MVARLALTASLLAVLILLPACAGLGQKDPVQASGLEMTRYRGHAVKRNARADVQQLAIDLDSGVVHFTDSDGKVHQTRLEARYTDQIRNLLADRAWQVGAVAPPEDAGNTLFYEVTVLEEGKPLKKGARWTSPPGSRLPQALVDLESAFDRLSRIADPLGNNVNLIR